MEDIKRNITIQWVGPFHSLEEVKRHRNGAKQGLFATPDCFNFYYFCGNKKRCPRRLSYRYFGIHHKLDGIHNRLNTRHEHFKDFVPDCVDIWIGALADLDIHSEDLVEDIESLFIALYNKYLTENDKKKGKRISDMKESICVINLWYDQTEKPLKSRPQSIDFFHDVIVCERDGEHPRYMVSKRLKNYKEDI